MSKKVVLVGHCGPDSSYLRMSISSAEKGAQVLSADDEASLQRVIVAGADLLLVNRVLDYGFAEEMGVDLIRRLKTERPELKLMLVSNYEDAQQAAVAAGALPGFGKRDLGGRRMGEMIREALGGTTSAQGRQ